MIKQILISFFVLFLFVESTCAQHTPILWGVTAFGGNDDLGTLYHYDPAADVHTLDHSFISLATGSNPEGNNMVNGGNGKYYGMTANGGNNFGGTLFEWDSLTNTSAKMIDFNSTTGYFPKGSLLLFGGKYYGMTSLGGANNKGVIFEWNPVTNVYTDKIDLSASLGGNPLGSLALYGVKLYGMTSTGGVNNKGVIFEWDPSTNTYTKKYDFSSASGTNPNGSLVIQSGKFYGTTYAGGTNNSGVIFEWDPATNAYVKKIDLAVATGKNPCGDLTYFGSKFYGMTNLGGAGSNGVIFEWNPATNIYAKKIDFITTNGAYPRGSLSGSGTKLYGLTKNGGVNDLGIIFEWDPSTNAFVKKIDLTAASGTTPYGSMAFINGYFYGMTNLGGYFNQGVLFQWAAGTNAFVKKVDFNSNNNRGNEPDGSLAFYSGKFYGVTNKGGSNNFGVIFEWDPLSNTYTDKYDFDSINGGNAQGTLVLNGTKFYGLASNGGANGNGVIFEWDPSANVYVKKIDLSSANGSNPSGSMLLYTGKFYGMTHDGGLNGFGVIFEWDPGTNVYTKKTDLTFAGGANPYGTLSLSGTKMYGMTNYGGTDSLGTIFEWIPATNVYTKKIDLDTLTGGNPYGSLILKGSSFYGLAFRGGTDDMGTIFRWISASNTFTKMFDFDLTSGGNPRETMVLSTSGKFYGTTSFGGIMNNGVLFEWDDITNTYVLKKNFMGTAGAPLGALPHFTQLVEATVNQIPVYSNNAISGHLCINMSGTNPFTLTDGDGDAIAFTKTSSNAALLPVSAITINSLGSGNYTISYTPAAGQTGSTTITITANDGFGGIVSYTYTLYVHALPVITIATTATTICSGQSETLIASGATSYAWTDSVINGTPFTPPSTTTYSVTATDVYGCINVSSVMITVDVVAANAGTNDTVCFGGTAMLNASPAGLGYTYSWSSGSSLSNPSVANPSATPAATTTYTVTITDGMGCSGTSSMTLSVDAQLNAASGSGNVSCNGLCDGSATAIPSGGSGSYVYDWNFGATPAGDGTSSITGLCAGTENVLISDSWGCSVSQGITITEPAAIDTSVMQMSGTLMANAGGVSYQWVDCNNSNAPVAGETNQTFAPLSSGNYAVIVSNGSCSSMSACNTILISGISENEHSAVSIYPSPTAGIVHINTDAETNASCELYNGLGQLIGTTVVNGAGTIDLSAQQNGIYIVKIRLKEEMVVRRIELIR